jgi:hypothetical protein
MDAVGLRLLKLALPFADKEQPVLVVDDSLFHHTSLKMFGSNVHHDHARSSRKIRQLGVGHRWVILSLVVSFSFAKRPFSVPALFRLYRSVHNEEHRSKPQLAQEMVQLVLSYHKV